MAAQDMCTLDSFKSNIPDNCIKYSEWKRAVCEFNKFHMLKG